MSPIKPPRSAPPVGELISPMENKIFLNRFRLSLSRGGQPVELHRSPTGATYRAQERNSGREVALELVPFVTTDASDRERFQAEATAAKQINQINIPTLYDFGIEDDQLVYATEYFDGHTAQAWVQARGPLSPGAVLRIALQVVAALGAASFHRIHHRALNPANVLFVPGQTAEGEWPVIKILHWLGADPTFETTQNEEARVDAAARFASPEQLRSEEVDFRSEVFSLGATMWFLLTGTAPAVTRSNGFAVEIVRPPVEKLRGLPKIVRHLLGRMLRPDPNQRPQDPVALSAYLQTCLARVERREKFGRRFGIPLATRPRAVRASVDQSLPYRRSVLAAALLVCAALGGLMLAGVLPGKHMAEKNARLGNEPILAQIATEPSPPAEGPAEVSTTPAAVAVSETPNAFAAQTQLAVEPAAIPKNEAPAVAQEKDPALVADLPNDSTLTPKAASRKTDRKKIAIHLAASRSPAKKKTIAQTTKRSEIGKEKKVRLAKANSNHHHAIPPLHVGSSRAQLVGTTSEGKWILSVASSGQRIIVPPPPGFEE